MTKVSAFHGVAVVLVPAEVDIGPPGSSSDMSQAATSRPKPMK